MRDSSWTLKDRAGRGLAIAFFIPTLILLIIVVIIAMVIGMSIQIHEKCKA